MPDMRIWDDQVAPFTQHYRVLRYDLRGFGRSAAPTQQPYAHEHDLRGLLASLGIDQAHIVGHSIGGAIAIDFALVYPAAAASLILVDSSFSGYQWPPELATELRAVWELAREGHMQAAKQRWLHNAIFGPAQEQPAVRDRLVQIVTDYSGWHWLHQDPRQPPDPPALQQLDRVTVPTLVLVGERDVSYTQANTDLLHQSIPSAHKVVVPGVGHMPMMEAPERFNDIVLGFLAER
jgi:3-oxoadipate enol-lactonase